MSSKHTYGKPQQIHACMKQFDGQAVSPETYVIHLYSDQNQTVTVLGLV